jgi:hypothetical protein
MFTCSPNKLYLLIATSALLLTAMDTEEDITDRVRRQAIMSPRMPELQPIQPRSAEELTPGELHSFDEIGLSPALSRSGPYEQMVKYGAQPRSGYYGSRYAGDDFQSEYGYKKKEFVNSIFNIRL